MPLPSGLSDQLNEISLWFSALPWGGHYVFDQALMAFLTAGLVLALTQTGERFFRSLLILAGLALLVGVLGFGVPAGQLLMALHLDDTPRQAWILAQWCALFAGVYLVSALIGYVFGRMLRALKPGRKNRRSGSGWRRLHWRDA